MFATPPPRRIIIFLCLIALIFLLSAVPRALGQEATYTLFAPLLQAFRPIFTWMPLISQIPPTATPTLTPLPTETPLPTITPTPPPPPDWSGAYGSVVSMAVDPFNPDVVYAGSWGGGVFRSTNQGNIWTWAGSGLGNYLIDSLAIDPTDGRILYAGTHAGGVYKSTDSGKHWLLAGHGIQDGAAVYAIAIHPGNPQVVYAGTRKTGNGLNLPYGGVLYKSIDGGGSWYPVLADIGGDGVQDWVYSITLKANPDLVLITSHEHGPYLSFSGEAGSWQACQVNGLSEYGKGRAIAFDPRSGSSTAFYATWHGGFYVSSDNGFNWRLATGDLDPIKVYPNGITFDWGRPDTMYLPTMDTANGVMKSTDAGRSWSSVGLTTDDIYSVMPLGDGVVLAGTVANGLFKSTDGGRTWRRSTSGMEIHPAAASPANAQPVFPEPYEELRSMP